VACTADWESILLASDKVLHYTVLGDLFVVVAGFVIDVEHQLLYVGAPKVNTARAMTIAD